MTATNPLPARGSGLKPVYGEKAVSDELDRLQPVGVTTHDLFWLRICNTIMAAGMSQLSGLIEGGMSHRDAVAKAFELAAVLTRWLTLCRACVPGVLA